jgi:hypothetical protein
MDKFVVTTSRDPVAREKKAAKKYTQTKIHELGKVLYLEDVLYLKQQLKNNVGLVDGLTSVLGHLATMPIGLEVLEKTK